MTKLEFITRYGEDAYEQHKNNCKKWRKEHKEQHKLANRICYEEHRINGYTKYCKENFDLIENYELAKADNFDTKKWHLHHRLENYWSAKTLKRKGLYYNLNPEALIWLPADKHHSDKSLSTLHPERTKWHKRILE